LKVAVSASGDSLDAAIDPRLGRCPYFMIVDTETMRSEAVPNTSQYAPSGAGIQAAQTIASKGASVVLTGNVGPNAYQALSGAGIQVITGVTGTVREAVTRYKDGELKSVTAPRAMGFGTGGGMGLGMGRGGGRGMGRGRGMGIRGFPQPTYPSPPSVASVPQLTREQEVQTLRSQMDLVQNQLDQIKKRLKELEEK
jgi:predicted Fe-Mo cluster-binding NifX family protein